MRHFIFFKIYKAEVENQLERKIKHVRSDRGGEYFSNEFNLFVRSMALFMREHHHILLSQMEWPRGKIAL
jgi:hypothetical protein